MVCAVPCAGWSVLIIWCEASFFLLHAFLLGPESLPTARPRVNRSRLPPSFRFLSVCTMPFRRRFRILANCDHGFDPYGQLFNQKIENFDIGFYPTF